MQSCCGMIITEEKEDIASIHVSKYILLTIKQDILVMQTYLSCVMQLENAFLKSELAAVRMDTSRVGAAVNVPVAAESPALANLNSSSFGMKIQVNACTHMLFLADANCTFLVHVPIRLENIAECS